MLCGIIENEAGEIKINDLDLDVDVAETDFGYVAQH